MYDIFKTLMPANLVLFNEPMRGHTSFKIGGAADVFVTPETPLQLTAVWKACLERGLPVIVLGGGNNVLVSDAGIRGVVIATGKMTEITVSGMSINAAAGATMGKLADTACKAGLSGLEFAHGIPGTVGGGVYMNAGAYRGEMKDVCTKVTALLPDGETVCYNKADLGLAYRTSRFHNEDAIILKAEFSLTPKPQEEIRATMDDLKTRRRDSQPIEERSAGSTFKRPKVEGMYAARMIEDCGLKGFTIGGAQVSTKHSGFVINIGNATAEDVLRLMDAVQEKIHAQTGIWLEPEVELLGFN